MERSESDPVAEWSTPGRQTGLEEPMWPLGLGVGSESYPERPGEADCIYYLRTGFCGYGLRCRFNHPRDRSSVIGAMRARGGEYPERFGQPVCQYFMRTGTCKFGASCKYHHPRQGGGSSSTVALNFSGYPLRPGEKECSYYIKTGQCKFGVICKFHHPQPAGVQVPVPAAVSGPLSSLPSAVYPAVQSPSVASSQQYGVVTGNWPVARPPLPPGAYLPGTFGPVLIPPTMVPFQGWSPYQTPGSSVASPNTQPTVGASPVYTITQLSPSAPAYTGSYVSAPSTGGPSSSSQRDHAFPERPGEPECQYYMRTGNCKFGLSCKYHHPQEWSAPNTTFVLGPMGLPLRPGAPVCSHYAQNGVCKFGPVCKFDHPMGMLSYSPSASSLADMPIAPYPVGSSIGTLAPSSSSSDLRPELIPPSTMESLSSSVTMSSGTVGSSFSKSAQVSQSTGSSSTSHPSI